MNYLFYIIDCRTVKYSNDRNFLYSVLEYFTNEQLTSHKRIYLIYFK